MNVSSTLSVDDVTSFYLYHARHSPTERRLYWKLFLFPPLLWTVVCLVLWRLADSDKGMPLQTFLDMLPLFLGGPVYLVVFPLLRRRGIKRHVENVMKESGNKALLGMHHLAITPEGICETTDLAEEKVKWAAVETVAESDHQVFLYKGNTAAFVVPKRAFADQSELARFLEQVDQYRRASGG